MPDSALSVTHVGVCTHSTETVERDGETLEQIVRDTTEADRPAFFQNALERVGDDDTLRVCYSEGGFDTPALGAYDHFVLDTADGNCHCHTHARPDRLDEALAFHCAAVASLNTVDLRRLDVFGTAEGTSDDFRMEARVGDAGEIKATSVTYAFDTDSEITLSDSGDETRVHAQASGNSIPTDRLQTTVESKLQAVEAHVTEVFG